MKPLPVINVASSAPNQGPARAGNSQQPETSFGHVLAQQANSGSNANAAATPPASNAQNADNSSSGSSQQTGNTVPAQGNGKGGKTKAAHGQTDTSGNTGDNSTASNPGTSTTTDAGSANGSAQLLALVSNLQQPATTDSSATTAEASAALTAVSANTSASNAQAALLNFQAAVASAGKNAAAAVANTDAKDSKPVFPGTSLKEALPSSTVYGKINVVTNNTTPGGEAPPSVTVDAKNATVQPALDLAAAAEKNIASGLAELDAAAVKGAAAIQSAATAALTAAPPVAQNVLQTNLAAAQLVGANDKLTPQVGTPGWDQALGQKVVWMVAGGIQSASLTLNPPDLGPMQVVLNVTNSHATATFTAAQPEVRQALESAMPKLREMLGDAGIQLGQASVNAGNAQQQQNFAEQNASKANKGLGQAADPIGAVATSSQVVQGGSSGIGLVDTFAWVGSAQGYGMPSGTHAGGAPGGNSSHGRTYLPPAQAPVDYNENVRNRVSGSSKFSVSIRLPVAR